MQKYHNYYTKQNKQAKNKTTVIKIKKNIYTKKRRKYFYYFYYFIYYITMQQHNYIIKVLI